jgi:hypothetical protein
MSHARIHQLAACLTFGLATLTVACADAPTAPTRPLVPSLTPALSSGAVIVRRDIVGQFWGGDPHDGLALVIGFLAPIADVCAANGDPLFGPVSPGSGMALFVPTGRVRFDGFSRAANVVVVQYGAGLLGTDVCPLVGAPVVATGTVLFTYRVSFYFDSPNQVAHATAQGIVNLTSGGQARLSASATFIMHADGTLVVDDQRVSLNPL